jgi:hypothetical protein
MSIVKGFNNFIEQKSKGLYKALVQGAETILEEADKIIPVDTGNLRNSSFKNIDTNNAKVTIGYTAEYAPYVHENLDANFRRPSAEAKFLEKAVNMHVKTVQDNIVKALKV